MKIVGPYTAPTIYSENPGIVELTSSDPSIASVDANVVVPGSRAWRNGLKHGQYLARANCLQSRDQVSFCLKIKGKDLIANGLTAFAYTQQVIATSFNMAAASRSNWKFMLHLFRNAATTFYPSVRYIQSASSVANEALYTGYNPPLSALPEEIRLIITLNGTTVSWYATTGTAADGAAIRAETSGTMGGSEVIAIMFPCELAKYERLLDQADREAFCQAGTYPATAAAKYAGAHEINPAAPVFYDTSGNALDLSGVNVTLLPPASASGDYTDDPGNPVVPFQPFTITPNSTGTFTITARRRRQGVPDRAPDDEKYEITSEPFTITEMPRVLCVGPSQTILRGDRDKEVLLFVSSDMPGVVNLVSSDINFEVPATINIQYGIFCAVVTCVAKGGCVATVTASKDAKESTCIVMVQQSAQASPVATPGTSRGGVADEDSDGRNINRLSLPTLEDVDYAVFDWINGLDIFVENSMEAGAFRKVPVVWVGAERAFQAKKYKDYRDISGSLMPPFITISRVSLEKNLDKKGQHWANVPAIYDYLQGVLPIRKEIRHDKTQQFMNNNAKRKTGKVNYKFDEDPVETKPVYEVSYVPIPVYLTAQYKIYIWTFYRTQLNTIEQKFLTYVPAGNINRFVLGHDGHFFEGFSDFVITEDGNLESLEKDERQIKASFTIDVLGHIAGEEQNQNSPYVSKRETFAETAVDIELKTKK